MELPFVITHRGALHQELVDVLVPLAAGNAWVPFQGFTEFMKELRVEHAATAAVQYFKYVEEQASQAAANLLPPQAAQQQQLSSPAAAGKQLRAGLTQAPLTKFFSPAAGAFPLLL